MNRTILLLCLFSVACGSSKSPTAPSPTPTATQTRIISLGGNMDFGSIQINQSFSATLAVRNDGNSPLTISGLSGSSSFISTLTTQGANFTLPPSTSHDVLVTFRPPAPQTYSGTLTVNADHTSGTNTIAFTGTGSLAGIPVFSKSGSGDQVFQLPAYVTRVRIQASTPSSCQNFAARIGGRLVVNVILGTCSVADARTIDNTYALSPAGGTVETQISTGVNWIFTEVR